MMDTNDYVRYDAADDARDERAAPTTAQQLRDGTRGAARLRSRRRYRRRRARVWERRRRHRRR